MIASACAGNYSLHTNCGWAVNPTTNKDYFDLFEFTVAKFAIRQENTWAIDKTGI